MSPDGTGSCQISSSDGTSEGSTYTQAADETPTTTEAPAETAAPAEDESSEEGRDELIALLTIAFDLETEEFATCMVDEMQAVSGYSYALLLESTLSEEDESDLDEISTEVAITCMSNLSLEEIEQLSAMDFDEDDSNLFGDESTVPTLEISSDPNALGAILSVEEIDFTDETIVGWLVF